MSYPEAYSSSEQTIHWDSLGGFGNVVDRRQWSLINYRLLTLLLSCSAALAPLPTPQDLVLFQPAYPPAVWVSLGESVDEYQAASGRDHHSQSPPVITPIMLCSPRSLSWSRRCLALSQRHRESLCWNCSRLISQVPGLTINSSSSDLYSTSCSAALVFSDGSRALSRSCRCLALSQRHRGPYHQQELLYHHQELSYQVRCRPRVSLPWELEPLQTPQIPSTYEASVVRIESHGVVWVFPHRKIIQTFLSGRLTECVGDCTVGGRLYSTEFTKKNKLSPLEWCSRTRGWSRGAENTLQRQYPVRSNLQNLGRIDTLHVARTCWASTCTANRFEIHTMNINNICASRMLAPRELVAVIFSCS